MGEIIVPSQIPSQEIQVRTPPRRPPVCIFRNLVHLCFFMTDTNLNFWGLLVVPVGVSICFGVGLLVWLRDEIRARNDKVPEEEHPKH
jgi:hypothetical protein